MTDRISFPPLRDLPPSHLEARNRHLLSTIARESARPRRSRLRFAALSGAVASAAAVGAVLAVVLSGGSGAKASLLLVKTIHGPKWSAAKGPDPARVATVRGTTSTAKAAATAIVGGAAGERTLLRSIIAGMQPTAIEEIAIANEGNEVALHMTTPDHSDRTQWEESLVVAAFRDRASAAGDQLTVRLFGGEADGAYLPPGPTTPLPAANRGDAAAAKALFESAAAKSAVPLADLTVYQPDGIAVAATLESDDPASFLVHQMPAFLAALGDRWTAFDGTFVSLEDSSGRTVWETSTNGRLLSGSAGAAPYLAGCSPVANWGPTPPPCPAK